MKLAWTIIFALANLLLVGNGLISSMQAIKLNGFLSALAQSAVSVLPFLAVVIYAVKGGLRWVWLAAVVLNVLLMLTALAFGVMASIRPAQWSFLGPLAMFLGLLPLANLLYLFYRQPPREAR